MKAKVSNKCISQIKQAIYDQGSNYEIGGILLGIRTPTSIVALQAVTIPSMDLNAYSYYLDGELATRIVNNSNYEFIGIWHSHVNSCNHFSKTDQRVNHEFSAMFNGIISILATLDDTLVKISAFYITKDRKNIKCN